MRQNIIIILHRQIFHFVFHQIFADYKEYEWRSVEIDGIFEGMVWHRLERLSIDGYDNPNPVLKFFQTLSKNQRYGSRIALLCWVFVEPACGEGDK